MYKKDKVSFPKKWFKNNWIDKKKLKIILKIIVIIKKTYLMTEAQ